MKMWWIGLTAMITIASTGWVNSAGSYDMAFQASPGDLQTAVKVKGGQGEAVKFRVKNSKRSTGKVEYRLYVKPEEKINLLDISPLTSGTIEPGDHFKGGQISKLDRNYVLTIQCVPMKKGETAECKGQISLESKRVSSV